MSGKNVANAVGGKTARACDSCVRKRARWYCAADDAFLCQSCNASVHSANPLARRHERVRLKIASSLKHIDVQDSQNSVPSWHGGFKRKARTPRHGKLMPKSEEPSPRQIFPLVPEVGADETMSLEENDDEQLLYRVPIYDPFVAELCTSSNSNEGVATIAAVDDAESKDANGRELKAVLAGYGQDVDNLDGFLPSDMDLAEFAADVESLLGGGLENECYGMEGLGLIMDCKEQDSMMMMMEGKVKLEEEEDGIGGEGDADVDIARETFELKFDYDSPATCGEEDEKVAVGVMSMKSNEENDEVGFAKKKRKILLNLDYESVISAWASQGSPWTTGCRPDFDADECWPDCMGSCGTDIHHHHPYGGMVMNHTGMGDGEREARVSRYREKRRTRLFSKKIRYEVRKLNAEKRPRMKGRFVKRASFGGGATGTGTASGLAPAYPLLTK